MDAFIFTRENLLSWPSAGWLGAGAILFALAWAATTPCRVMWQRIWGRALVAALAFTPLPAPEMFGEPALSGKWAVIPLWHALYTTLKDGLFFYFLAALLAWIIAAYLLWVAGMTGRHLANYVFRPSPRPAIRPLEDAE